MSIQSDNSKNRLFVSENQFNHEQNPYFERMYFLITDVKQDNNNLIVEVSIKFVVDVQSYLMGESSDFIQKTFKDKLPLLIKKSAEEYLTLKKFRG